MFAGQECVRKRKRSGAIEGFKVSHNGQIIGIMLLNTNSLGNKLLET